MSRHLPLSIAFVCSESLRLNLRRITAMSVAATLSVLFCAVAHAVPPRAATTTSLAVLSGGSATTSVASGTVVTLTATVLTGSAPVTTGQVNFCDADGTACVDNYLLGTVQLTSTGVANLRFRPGIGAHTYKAVFVGTATSTTSVSSTAALEVAGAQATSTTLTQTGVAGNYTLAATVAGTGSTAAPTGTVSFLDTTNKNTVLSTATLGSPTFAQTFASQVTYPTGTMPITSVTADFNNDGFQDIAMVNYGDHTVGILIGNGDGTFAAQVPYATGTMPSYVAAGDFNSDGNVDLAVVNSASNTVSVLIGKGDGTFLNQVTYATGTTPAFVAAADIDGDGILDLLVSSAVGGSVGVFLGKGDGTFNAQVAVTAGSGVLSIAVADFNGDGIQDLAVTNYNSNTVSVLIGKGAGAFAAPVTYAVGSAPQPIIAADFNRDGFVDLAVANYHGNTISILTGKGDGTFNPQVTYATGTYPFALAASDYNGDGILDLAVDNYHGNTVGLFLGKGDGTFAAQVTYPTGGGPDALSTADFNGDGIADLVVGNYTDSSLSILLGQVSTTATATATGISPAGAVTSAHAVDASYAGDGFYAASTSTTVPLTAQPVVTALTLSASPTTSSYGQQVVLSAILSPYTAQSISTNGELVTFYNGSQSLGVAALANGVATFNLTSLPLGASAITANYPGDSSFLPSASASVAHTVSQPTASLSVAAQSLPFGTATATLTAQLTYTGTVAPTAPISFTIDSGAAVAAMCTGSSSPLTCTATYAIGSLAPGAHTITATQAADGVYAADSTTAALTLVTSDFSFTASGTTSQTVTGGSVATFTFALSPGALAYPGSISFAVTGLATGMTSTLTPTSVATSAGPQTVTLAVQTVKLTSQADSPLDWPRRSGVAFAVLLLPFCFIPSRRLNARLLLLLFCGILFPSAFTGCGSSAPATSTPTQVTSTITVAATAAGYATPHSANVTLIVQ